jgi:hypothetical protein
MVSRKQFYINNPSSLLHVGKLHSKGFVTADLTGGKSLLSGQLLILIRKGVNTFIRIYKTIILPVVLYGCETWYLALREEHRLRVFENRVLRRIFGPERDEETGEWRKLHNVELHDLYSSPSIIRIIKSRGMRWAGHVARMGRR